MSMLNLHFMLSSVLFFSGCTSPELPPASPLIMLTPTEYNNTIRDLFGFSRESDEWVTPQSVGSGASTSWPWVFPEESGVHGFEGMSAGQSPSPYLLEQLQQAAAHFALYSTHSDIFFTCSSWETRSNSEKQTCGLQSLVEFTHRAWRRPLTDEELQRLQDFWNQNWTEYESQEAIHLSVSGILQSPAFLYRIEQGRPQGDYTAADNWDMASRLSYFLWDSIPDATLSQAAAEGKLRTRAQVRAQAERMIDDNKARSAVIRFHQQWLETDEMHKISPTRRVYGPLYYGINATPVPEDDFEWPNILIPLRSSMTEETQLFVERTIFDGGGTFASLMTDNHGYMSSRTEPLYGDETETLGGQSVTIEEGDYEIILRPAEFPATQRAGLLTLPSVLALRAHPVHPAPILRGAFLLEKILCTDLGPPPPGAEASTPSDVENQANTNRERTEQATSAAACSGCHNMLNPLGFAFENYDSMGGWRDQDEGMPIDATGSMQIYNEIFSFSNAIELTQQISQSATAKDCYATQWVQYATGITLENDAIESIQERFRNDDNIKTLLVEIASSDLFRFRAGVQQ